MPKVITKLVFNNEELAWMQTGVIVERWHAKSIGAGRRSYQQTFTENERETVEKSIYPTIYRWYYKGLPNRMEMTVLAYNLLIKTCNFFGSI